MDFEKFVANEIGKNNNHKFVIVLGSGYHKHVLGDSDNPLISWDNLLKKLDSLDIKEEISTLVRFELLIPKEAKMYPGKAAAEIEKQLLKKATDILKKGQSEAIDNYKEKFPLWLFNEKYVSDVVNLNFDLIPELLLSGKSLPRSIPVKHIGIPNKKGHYLPCTRHREINGVNFWHPHGDIASYESLILGVRKYGNNIQKVEHLRQLAKRREKNNSNITKETWVDRLLKQPILVIGAGISDVEYDVWFAIINRLRNFAKTDHQEYQAPIFKMMKASEDVYKDILFSPILRDSDCYTEQWEHLEKIFS